MSTIAPPSKPLNPALVDSEHYIDDQIRRTRRALKLVDLAAGLITLAIGLLGFVLLAAVLDHWVVPGGLSEAGRIGVFGLMLVALLWYAWRQFAPLLKPINPVYAAQTIERGTPSLKNSLLNLLLFRTHRQQMSTRVYHALEQQAALRLSSAPIDTSIDRTALLRLGYALLLIVAVCAAYAVLSPKNMAVSAARVFAPWTDLAPPSRVQILDVKPGDAAVALGEQLEISAAVDGLRDDERVEIRYSTLDEQLVDQSAPMKLPAANARRFTGLLPPSGAQIGHSSQRETLGVQQDLVYWIEAGDARSKRYTVNVFTRPTITVQKVQYDYPAYTGFPSNETTNTGDVSGLEGTRVTISALANKPIKSAYIDFDADGRNDLKMNVDGDRATATFELALRDDRRTPQHVNYVLKFTSVENRTNDDPPKYRIEVKPDYAPEVRITEPEEPELTVRADETVPIGVEARDPDFALGGVRLVGKVGDREATLIDLLDKRHERRFGAIRPFTPAEAKLKPGDVLEYWAEARDNRRPDANIAMSEHRRLRIAAPDQQKDGQQQQQQPGGQGQQGQPQQGDGGQGNQQQNGQQGGGQQGEPQNNGQEGDQQNGENQGQQGPGGAGAQGQQNDKAQSEQGAGGQGAASESQNNQQQQEPGQGSGASANDAQQSPNDQQQQNGAGNSSTQGGQPQGGNQQQQRQPGEGAAGESASADGQSGQQQSGGVQSGSPQGAPPEKVSSQGDDDSTAMQRIAEHLNNQDGQQPQPDQQADGEPASAGGQSTQQQEPQGGAQQPQEQTEVEMQNGAQQQGAQPNQGENANGKQGQQNGANQAQQQGQPNGPQQAAEGAPSNQPRQPAGDAQQQGAGQQDGERQGADAAREAKPGDGKNQEQGVQQPSAESNASNNQSGAGAGHSSDEQQGSTSQNNMQGAEKRDGDQNQKLEGDQEPPSGANSRRESDSEGGQSGDQAGGGQDGAGQHADAAGKGSPGQNETADAGGGRANEQGEGETGANAGDQQLADGKTGQSSGDQQGAGSQQRESDEQTGAQQSGGEGAAAKPQAGAGEQQSPQGQPGEEKGSDQAGGKQAHQPQAGDQQQPQPDGESASADGQSGREQPQNTEQQRQRQQQAKQSEQSQQRQSGDQQSSNRPPGGQAGSSQPQGGGQGGVADSSNQSQSDEAREDEANLEYARQQTNLVLQRLEDQLAKQQVDQDMLKNLGWTEEELQQFVNRWKSLKDRAHSEGGDAAEAREELDDALRSLGLRKQAPLRTNVKSKDDNLRVNDSYRTRPPVEYADRVRAYSKSVGSSD